MRRKRNETEIQIGVHGIFFVELKLRAITYDYKKDIDLIVSRCKKVRTSLGIYEGISLEELTVRIDGKQIIFKYN